MFRQVSMSDENLNLPLKGHQALTFLRIIKRKLLQYINPMINNPILPITPEDLWDS